MIRHVNDYNWKTLLKSKTVKLPFQTSHVQSLLDTAGYGGLFQMISTAVLKGNTKQHKKILLDWKQLTALAEMRL